MSFLFILLFFVGIIVLVILLGALNFVLSILRGIFSFGRRPKNNSSQSSTVTRRSSKKENLLFDKNEAEDTDYEEIK